jgi:hypothetical protein
MHKAKLSKIKMVAEVMNDWPDAAQNGHRVKPKPRLYALQLNAHICTITSHAACLPAKSAFGLVVLKKFHLEKTFRTRYKIHDRVEALLMLASSVICEVQP